MNEENNLYKSFAKLMVVLLFIVPIAYLRGFVFAYGWNRFVVTSLDTKPISIAVSYGLMLMVSLATVRINTDDKKDEQLAMRIIYAILFPLMLWGFMAVTWEFAQ